MICYKVLSHSCSHHFGPVQPFVFKHLPGHTNYGHECSGLGAIRAILWLSTSVFSKGLANQLSSCPSPFQSNMLFKLFHNGKTLHTVHTFLSVFMLYTNPVSISGWPAKTTSMIQDFLEWKYPYTTNCRGWSQSKPDPALTVRFN